MAFKPSSPKVTVIIPTYNHVKVIGRTIESVLSQTYSDFEILVIDDRGTPDTKPTVEAFVERDPRVRYIPNEVRLGLMENKNKGVRLSSPSVLYMAFLDDDDAYLPKYLERTVAEMEKHPDAVAVTTDCELRHQNGEFVKRYRCEREIFWKISIGNGCLVRKSVFTKLNIWYDKDAIFEDLDFGVRVVKDHAWVAIPEVLRIYYRYYDEQGTSMSTMYTRSTPREKLEYFMTKNGVIYEAAGNHALAWIHSLTGKMLIRAGHFGAGRKHLRKSLTLDPRPSYLAYYLIALFFPSAFAKQSIAVWKNKILGKLEKE
ncbi:MAG: glycosyltransferase family A protein [Minisyncoccia bacterium]